MWRALDTVCYQHVGLVSPPFTPKAVCKLQLYIHGWCGSSPVLLVLRVRAVESSQLCWAQICFPFVRSQGIKKKTKNIKKPTNQQKNQHSSACSIGLPFLAWSTWKFKLNFTIGRWTGLKYFVWGMTPGIHRSCSLEKIDKALTYYTRVLVYSRRITWLDKARVSPQSPCLVSVTLVQQFLASSAPLAGCFPFIPQTCSTRKRTASC